MKKLILFMTLVFFVGTSCQKRYDIEADRQALVKLTAEDWDANFLSGNPDANVDFYTENAMRIDDDGKIYSGKDAIRALITAFPEEYIILKIENKAEDIKISGDLATVRGTFSGSSIYKESGDTINMEGVWVDICERQADGLWKMSLTIVAESED